MSGMLTLHSVLGSLVKVPDVPPKSYMFTKQYVRVNMPTLDEHAHS